jgi:PIN domain nuclease of toxin-antitoxin system
VRVLLDTHITLWAAARELHHNDPFDRMLVAQAISEPLRLLTHDRTLLQYGDCVQFV